jgi:hypothetical protein
MSIISNEELIQGQHEMLESFGFARQCLDNASILDLIAERPGEICICGHGVDSHPHAGLCQAGSNICYCRGPKPVLWVSDKRSFYKATKGPHEAHALLLGLADLESKNGTYRELLPWICQSRNCGSKSRVGPVRMRSNSDLALGLSVHDYHRFMCDSCLFHQLNGSY